MAAEQVIHGWTIITMAPSTEGLRLCDSADDRDDLLRRLALEIGYVVSQGGVAALRAFDTANLDLACPFVQNKNDEVVLCSYNGVIVHFTL